ncbi:MAG: peptidoglycan DD-metalloendopeptidase family protein [Pseudomonadota bacterium]
MCRSSNKLCFEGSVISNARQLASGRSRSIGALLVVGLLATSNLVPLRTADAQSATQLKQTKEQRRNADRRLRSTQRSLDETRRREQAARENLRTAEDERAALNRQLIDTARRVQTGETRLSEIEERLSELDAQRQLINGSLLRQQRSIGELLAALQRMGRNPPPVMMTKRRDALGMVRSAMLLSSVFPELRERAVALNNRLIDLDRVATEIKTQGDRLREQNRLLAQAEDRLDDLLHTKKATVAQTQQELDEIRQVAAAQARNVRSLGELITRLDKTVERYTKLGEYERDLKARRALEARRAQEDQRAQRRRQREAQERRRRQQSEERDIALLPPQTPKIDPPKARPPQTPANRTRTEPSARLPKTERPRSNKTNPGRLKPSIAFARAKGRLTIPASGRRIFGFGGKTRVGNGRAKGIAIETRARAQITSPNDGWVVYAGPFRSYGQLLIINAGGGYHILLAGLERINARIGQFVLAGEPVGKMRGNARKAGKRSQVDAPILYIEFRYKGRPIDPDPWWNTRSG